MAIKSRRQAAVTQMQYAIAKGTHDVDIYIVMMPGAAPKKPPALLPLMPTTTAKPATGNAGLIDLLKQLDILSERMHHKYKV
jgi:hypothetical protein